jgi:ribosomal protein S11
MSQPAWRCLHWIGPTSRRPWPALALSPRTILNQTGSPSRLASTTSNPPSGNRPSTKKNFADELLGLLQPGSNSLEKPTKSESVAIAESISALLRPQPGEPNVDMRPTPEPLAPGALIEAAERITDDPHRLHVFSHRHNTHITLAKPNGDALLSLSCGNIGFKKGHRGSYEAAFQLSSYVLRQIQERGYLTTGTPDYITQVELILRGWADGRMAFTTALLGVEGRFIRNKISWMADATRIKIGGNRSPKPRRLG